MDIDTPPPEVNKTPKKKEAARRFAEAYSHKSLSSPTVQEHILSYLLRNCYRETALAFLSADITCECYRPTLSPGQLSQLDGRRAMMDAVLNGDILRAIDMADKMLGTSCSILFPMVYLRLLCQHFVELVRNRKTHDALSFAQQTIAPFAKQHPDGLSLLQGYLPLLAYHEPELSPLFELVDGKKREELAEALNGSVFGHLREKSGETQYELERLMQQLTMVMRRIREGNPKWCLEDALEDRAKE